MNRQRSPCRSCPREAAVARIEPLEGRRLMSVVLGLQPGNALVAFDSTAPAVPLATVRVRGLAQRENLLAIDYRPATGALYALGSSNRLYTIDPAAGRATPVGTTTFAVRLNGTSFGIDFDPDSDRLRVVSDADQNFQLHPDTGEVIDADPAAPGVQADANLAFAATDLGPPQNPAVIAVAHANRDADPATPGTALFGIDANLDLLVRQGSPAGAPGSPGSGTLFPVGALGVDVEIVGGFDVVTAGATDTAFAALSTNLRRASQLYTVDLGTGAATAVGNIGRRRRATLGLAAAPAGTPFFVATARNELLRLDTATPGVVAARRRISGFASSRERVVGIDVRPATGELWALTDADRLYTLDPATGAATAVGGPSAVDLAARTASGFDFDPAADRLRVTNAAGQNVRFDPATGAAVDADPADADVDPDAMLAFAAGDPNAGLTPRVVGAAYASNTADAAATTLYGLDAGLDVLVRQGSTAGAPASADAGQIVTVGATTRNLPDELGFDIVTRNGIDGAFAVLAPPKSRGTGLYSVNLATGAMTLVSTLNNRARNVVAMALVP